MSIFPDGTLVFACTSEAKRLTSSPSQLYTLCNTADPDTEQMKLCRTMINELCEEFTRTLDACTQNVLGDDDRDTSTPLIRR